MKSITKTTLKTFVKNNHGGLFVREDSRFDGNTDAIERRDDAQFVPVVHVPAGIDLKGITRNYVLHDALDLNFISGNSSTTEFENAEFKGYRHSNCCGAWVLAVRKDGVKHNEALKLSNYDLERAGYALESYDDVYHAFEQRGWQEQNEISSALNWGHYNFVFTREYNDATGKYSYHTTKFGRDEIARAKKEEAARMAQYREGEAERTKQREFLKQQEVIREERIASISFVAKDYSGKKDELKAVKVKMPAVNKNSTMAENDKWIADESITNEYRIKRTVEIAAKDWAFVCDNLMSYMSSLWMQVGGAILDDEFEYLLEGVNQFSREAMNIYRTHGYMEIIEVINDETRETFYVDTQGYDYARYVGRAVGGNYSPLTEIKDTAEVIAFELFDAAMTQRDAKAYISEDFHKIYDALEDANRHDDCAIFYAKRYGCEADVMMLESIKARHDERGYLSHADSQLRYAIEQAIKDRCLNGG